MNPAFGLLSIAMSDHDKPLPEPKLLFSEEEWNAAMPELTRKMTAHLKQFRTPLFIDHGEYGEGWGSGSFIEFSGRKGILTNEHVARAMTNSVRLGFRFDEQDELRRVEAGTQVHKAWPWDLAMLPVSDEMWSSVEHRSALIQVDQISLAHTPIEGEVFAFSGYAEDRVRFLFGEMQFIATTSVAREGALASHNEISERFHFGLEYRPDLATLAAGHHNLPRPPGLSGSTVWNTCFVEAKTRGIEWTPALAKVAGVVWGWPSGQGLIVATKAEHVRSFLLGAAAELA